MNRLKDETKKDETRKNKIRKDILTIRNALEESKVIRYSSKITKRVLDMDEYLKSNIVMCYMDFKNEVQTREIVSYSFALGKRVCVPFICKSETVKDYIIASEIFDGKNDLVKGTYGIFEPRNGLDKQIMPEELDLVIVPGVAFDLKKNRIGFGAGYYDCFLKDVRSDCTKLGVAYEFQIVEVVPVNKYDVSMDFVITQSRII